MAEVKELLRKEQNNSTYPLDCIRYISKEIPSIILWWKNVLMDLKDWGTMPCLHAKIIQLGRKIKKPMKSARVHLHINSTVNLRK